MILHKLRRAMVAPERSQLTGWIEVDETYVGGNDVAIRVGSSPFGRYSQPGDHRGGQQHRAGGGAYRITVRAR